VCVVLALFFLFIFKEDSVTKKAEAIPHAAHSNNCTGEEKQMSAYLVSIPSNKIFIHHPPFLSLPISSALLNIGSLSKLTLSAN